MNLPYSVWADLLAKFHTSPEWIQALWLVAIPALILGVTWCVTRLVKDIAVAALGIRQGQLIYGVYQDEQGRWLVYRNGREAAELDWRHPPREL
jgi:hypothetical protein